MRFLWLLLLLSSRWLEFRFLMLLLMLLLNPRWLRLPRIISVFTRLTDFLVWGSCESLLQKSEMLELRFLWLLKSAILELRFLWLLLLRSSRWLEFRLLMLLLSPRWLRLRRIISVFDRRVIRREQLLEDLISPVLLRCVLSSIVQCFPPGSGVKFFPVK